MPGDHRHADAVAMLSHLAAAEQVLTSNLVIGETWTFLRRKDSHRSAVAFLDRARELEKRKRLAVHHVTIVQENQAWTWLRKRDERRYSFVDATSFALMRNRRLREAFAFDHDFAAAGFVVLQP